MGDPKFRNADNGDFALLGNSPCKDSGADLSKDSAVLPVITIQGEIYKFSFSEVLDPILTDWSNTPPTVVTTDQNSYGNWGKGAYIFTEKDQLSPPNNLSSPNNLRVH
jgi:hypothetical protein